MDMSLLKSFTSWVLGYGFQETDGFPKHWTWELWQMDPRDLGMKKSRWFL